MALEQPSQPLFNLNIKVDHSLPDEEMYLMSVDSDGRSIITAIPSVPAKSKRKRIPKPDPLWDLEPHKIEFPNNKQPLNLQFSELFIKKTGKCYSCKTSVEKRLDKKGTLCSKCARIVHLKRKYNITEKTYKFLLNKQNNICAICGGQPLGGHWKRFYVDYNHKTNTVRGLLCSRCNVIIGQVRENIDILLSSIKYLREGVTYSYL